MKWTGNGEDGLENCVEATEKGLRIEHCWSNAANQYSRLRPWIRCNTSLWGVRKKNDGREDRKKNGRIKGLNRSVDRQKDVYTDVLADAWTAGWLMDRCIGGFKDGWIARVEDAADATDAN